MSVCMLSEVRYLTSGDPAALPLIVTPFPGLFSILEFHISAIEPDTHPIIHEQRFMI